MRLPWTGRGKKQPFHPALASVEKPKPSQALGTPSAQMAGPWVSNHSWAGVNLLLLEGSASFQNPCFPGYEHCYSHMNPALFLQATGLQECQMSDVIRRARTQSPPWGRYSKAASAQMSHLQFWQRTWSPSGMASQKAPLDAHVFHLAAKTRGHSQQGAVGTGAAPGRAQVL